MKKRTRTYRYGKRHQRLEAAAALAMRRGDWDAATLIRQRIPVYGRALLRKESA